MRDDLELVKDRPLAPGHRLELYVDPGRKKDRTVVASCSCGEELVYGSARTAQAALDAAARSHGSELAFGDYRLGRILRELALELAYLDVEEILEQYGRPYTDPPEARSGPVSSSVEDYLRAELKAELEHRLWTEEPRARRTPLQPRRLSGFLSRPVS